MKTVVLTKTALGALRKYANRRKVILSKIQQYAAEPSAQANQVRALTGSNYLRLRVGDFRVIFTESADTITVIDIGPRGSIYQ